MTKDDLLGRLEGCGDSACYIKRPAGMATQGGCRCTKAILDADARHRVIRALMLYRQFVTQEGGDR